MVAIAKELRERKAPLWACRGFEFRGSNNTERVFRAALLGGLGMAAGPAPYVSRARVAASPPWHSRNKPKIRDFKERTQAQRRALFVCEGSPASPLTPTGHPRNKQRMEVRSALGPAITRAGGIKPKEDA
jgi:hypothetical protein